MNRRRYGDHVLAVLVWLSASAIAGLFLWLLADMASHGFDRLSWSFLTTEPERSGRRGGTGGAGQPLSGATDCADQY